MTFRAYPRRDSSIKTPGLRNQTALDLHDFLFLARKHLIDLGDMRVGDLLDFAGLTLLVVLADGLVLELLLQGVDAVAPHVSDGDARLLRIFVRDLHEFLAALLIEFGD